MPIYIHIYISVLLNSNNPNIVTLTVVEPTFVERLLNKASISYLYKFLIFLFVKLFNA